MSRDIKRKHAAMLRILVDVLNLVKLPKRLPVKRKKVYGSLVKSVIMLLPGEKDDGDSGARQKEKRKAKEKVNGFVERRHGKGWS